MESGSDRSQRLERVSETLSRANRDAFDALCSVVMAGRSVCVVGAGISVRSGYPSWGNLLTRLGDEAMRIDPSQGATVTQLARMQDSLWRVERYRAMIGDDRYFEFLRRTFEPKAQPLMDSAVKTLVRLNFSHFLTTNYDDLLEQAHFELSRDPGSGCGHWDRPRIVDWMNSSDVRELMYEMHQPHFGRRYVYLHGHYKNPSSIVLTDKDYTERYLRSLDSSRKLFALLSTQTLVFIGYSMTDPAIMNLLREVKVHMGVGGPRHYAILAVNTASPAEQDEAVQRMRLSSAFGVEAIFYPYTDKHEGLEQLLSLLKKATLDPVTPTDEQVMETMRLVRPAASAVVDPDDPQKNRWGGIASVGGYELAATVDWARKESSEKLTTSDGRRLFAVKINVSGPALSGVVRFHLHPTVVPMVRDVEAKAGRAELDLITWGAFTVGAELLSHNVKLELDLSEVRNAPARFRMS